MRTLPFAIRIAAFGLTTALWITPAVAAETYTATARLKSAGGVEATAPVTVIVERFSTDAERDELTAAIKKSGTQGARDLLQGRNPVGTLKVGGQNLGIKHASSRTTPNGRLITVATALPIAFVGAGVPGAQSKTGFDVGVVMLEFPGAGAIKGEIVPAAKVRIDQQGALVTEDYNSASVVQLSDVKKQ